MCYLHYFIILKKIQPSFNHHNLWFVEALWLCRRWEIILLLMVFCTFARLYCQFHTHIHLLSGPPSGVHREPIQNAISRGKERIGEKIKRYSIKLYIMHFSTDYDNSCQDTQQCFITPLLCMLILLKRELRREKDLNEKCDVKSI